MVIFRGNGYHALSAEGIAVHHQGLHDLRHDLALFSVQNGLLFFGQNHIYPILSQSFMATSQAPQITVRKLPTALASPITCTPLVVSGAGL